MVACSSPQASVPASSAFPQAPRHPIVTRIQAGTSDQERGFVPKDDRASQRVRRMVPLTQTQSSVQSALFHGGWHMPSPALSAREMLSNMWPLPSEALGPCVGGDNRSPSGLFWRRGPA